MNTIDQEDTRIALICFIGSDLSHLALIEHPKLNEFTTKICYTLLSIGLGWDPNHPLFPLNYHETHDSTSPLSSHTNI